MNFITAFLERRRQVKAERERLENERHAKWLADYKREQKAEQDWWDSLTPDQKEAHRRQEQLDRIERRLKDIQWRQQYDSDDYDIVGSR